MKGKVNRVEAKSLLFLTSNDDSYIVWIVL
jgi:hypothetical protein